MSVKRVRGREGEGGTGFLHSKRDERKWTRGGPKRAGRRRECEKWGENKTHKKKTGRREEREYMTQSHGNLKADVRRGGRGKKTIQKKGSTVEEKQEP